MRFLFLALERWFEERDRLATEKHWKRSSEIIERLSKERDMKCEHDVIFLRKGRCSVCDKEKTNPFAWSRGHKPSKEDLAFHQDEKLEFGMYAATVPSVEPEVVTPEAAATAALAYAIWDTYHPSRMHPEDQQQYFEEAKSMQHWLNVHGYAVTPKTTADGYIGTVRQVDNRWESVLMFNGLEQGRAAFHNPKQIGMWLNQRIFQHKNAQQHRSNAVDFNTTG